MDIDCKSTVLLAGGSSDDPACLEDAIIIAMASLAEARDPDIGGHGRRIEHYVAALARQLRFQDAYRAELSDDNLALLLKAAALHDIGKVQVPDAITLAQLEYGDGSCYPQAQAGRAMALSARLMAVAEVYDALISPRSYRPAFTHETAVELIRQGRGLHFDPDVVDAMLAIDEQFKTVALQFSFQNFAGSI